MRDIDAIALVGVISMIANLIILGLNIKLYTEYFKDRSIGKRRREASIPRFEVGKGEDES